HKILSAKPTVAVDLFYRGRRLVLHLGSVSISSFGFFKQQAHIGIFCTVSSFSPTTFIPIFPIIKIVSHSFLLPSIILTSTSADPLATAAILILGYLISPDSSC